MCSWWQASEIARYGFGDGHPFGPDRHAAFMRELHQCGLDGRVQRGTARGATREELEWFHTPAYVDLVRERSASGFGYLDAGDTPALRGVYEAASDVVGATLECSRRRHDGQRAARVHSDRGSASRRARARGRLLRVQRLRRGDRNAPAPARPAAHRLRRHRRASRRRRVLRVRGRSGPAVRGHARGRPLPLSRHRHGRGNRRRARRAARS